MCHYASQSYFQMVEFHLQEAANSAALGSAYMAKQGIRDRSAHGDPRAYFKEITKSLSPPQLACKPYSDADKVTMKWQSSNL